MLKFILNYLGELKEYLANKIGPIDFTIKIDVQLHNRFSTLKDFINGLESEH